MWRHLYFTPFLMLELSCNCDSFDVALSMRPAGCTFFSEGLADKVVISLCSMWISWKLVVHLCILAYELLNDLLLELLESSFMQGLLDIYFHNQVVLWVDSCKLIDELTIVLHSKLYFGKEKMIKWKKGRALTNKHLGSDTLNDCMHHEK